MEGDEPWPTEPALEDVGFTCTACARFLAPDEDVGGGVCWSCAERAGIEQEGEGAEHAEAAR